VVIYFDPDLGRDTTQAFRAEVDAEDFLIEVLTRRRAGRPLTMNDPTTVTEMAREYLENRRYSYAPHTIERVAGVIRRSLDHPGSPLGRMRRVDVRLSHAQRWVDWLSAPKPQGRGLGAQSVRAEVGTLQAMFTAAVADRLLDATPMPRGRLKLPRIPETIYVPLTLTQVRQLAAAMPPQMQTMVRVQADLGLRLGEVQAIRLGDIDWPIQAIGGPPRGGAVRILDQVTDGGQRRQPKYGSVRRIPVDAETLADIRAHMLRWPPLVDPGGPNDGLIFYQAATSRERGPVLPDRPYRNTYRKGVTEAARRLHAADPTFPAGITDHDLRHHFGSEMALRSGGDGALTQALLGHKSSRTTERYVHKMPGGEDRARQAMAERRRAAEGGSETATEGTTGDHRGTKR